MFIIFPQLMIRGNEYRSNKFMHKVFFYFFNSREKNLTTTFSRLMLFLRAFENACGWCFSEVVENCINFPAHKAVVLGLITSKFPQLEDVDDLVKRVHNAANIIASGEPKRTFEEALNQCVPCPTAVGCAADVCARVGSASVPSVGSPRTRREITSTSTRCVRSSPLSWRPRRRSGATREIGCAGKRKVG